MSNKTLFKFNKSNIDSHTYIKSPLNYHGNKYKILPQIIPLFPKSINTFIDAFGGSATVLLNTVANRYIYIEKNPKIFEIISGMFFTDYETIIDSINKILNKYDLTRENETAFLKLRKDYNDKVINDWITLYVLHCFSFNWLIRFNQIGDYNSSWSKGHAYYTERQKESIKQLKDKFATKSIKTYNYSIFNFNFSELTQDDFIYFDPPYLNSEAVYNDTSRGFCGYTTEDEKQLLSILEQLNKRQVKWGLSNNLGYTNSLLEKFILNYNIHYINRNYNSCNYIKKNILENSNSEIFVTNY